MRLLITGGAGYVGSATVELLVAAGHRVTVFDNLSQGHRLAVDPRATLVVGDLLDRAATDVVVARSRPDAVLHFAARTVIPESASKPMLYLQQNVVGSLNLLDSMTAHGVSRFVFSSTAGLFGDTAATELIGEEHPILPSSPYSESKYVVERMLYWLARNSDFRYAILRYFNAAGATLRCGEDHHPETHLIPLILQTALGRRQRMTICGADHPTPDGTCVRDYVHVADLAEAHVLALAALESSSCTYNIGSGRGFSVTEVIEAARRVTSCPIPTEVGPRRDCDPPVLIACNAKIREELGWQPRYTEIEQIVETAWVWLKKHPFGYEESPIERAQLVGHPSIDSEADSKKAFELRADATSDKRSL